MAETPTIETIRTERLLLRPPRPSDAGALGHYSNDPRLARMTSTIPHPYPPGAADAFVERAAAGRLDEEVWVMDASPVEWSEVVGVITFRPKAAEIGYWVGVPFWGTGFASEAVGGVVDHLFRTRGIDRITAEVQAENEASLRVLGKVGFRRTGEKPLFSVARGEVVPGLTLALDRADRGL
ncbi:MAG TPA: GNAT family N-acetyltransferase [Thermohalobaculum sp.]|nr:GNAT family N-acetyltransferase [Thermohalobaculum sp.]